MALRDLHLADLHEQARQLDVPRYRLLTRDELVEAIDEGGEEKPKAGGDEKPKAGGEEKPKRKRAQKPKGKRDQKPKRDREEKPKEEEEVETEEVTGVLDRMPQGYGFLRLGDLQEAEGDVYVSASQIRRCELRPGDEVRGPARAPRRGERHRALVRVEAVNDQEPEAERTHFEDLTPKGPHRELLPEGEAGLPETLSFGHRVLVNAEEAPQASEQLQSLAAALTKAKADVTVLLAGPAADDAKAWEKAASGAEIIGDDPDLDERDRVRAAELAIGRTKRRVEGGADPVVIIDSLSAMAAGYRDPSRVKRMFSSGRELAEDGTGSLTIIAAVVESDERADKVRKSLSGTEDVLLKLAEGS
jgi:transcription termination factor Rho